MEFCSQLRADVVVVVHGGCRWVEEGADGGYVGPCKARRRSNSVKAGRRAPRFPLVPRRAGIGHLGNAFSSHKPLSLSHFCCSRGLAHVNKLQLSQLIIPSVGPIYLLTVRSHLTLKYLSGLKEMLGHEECKGWRINQSFWKWQLWQ